MRADGVKHVVRNMLHAMVVTSVTYDLRENPGLAVGLEARGAIGDDRGAAELLHPALPVGGTEMIRDTDWRIGAAPLLARQLERTRVAEQLAHRRDG